MNPQFAIVTGSGLDLAPLLDTVTREVPFAEFSGLPIGAVPGHDHKFLIGASGSCPIVLQCGRHHFYEGFDLPAIARTVDLLHEWGVRTVLFVSAAGGLVPGMAPGDTMAVDRIRLWRYRRWDATPGTLFPDFVPPECDFYGTYQWVFGPSYETRAEIAAFQYLHAAAIGMSTAPELMRCQELGIRAAMIACITNSCCRPHTLSHDEVLAEARASSGKIAALIRRNLSALASHTP